MCFWGNFLYKFLFEELTNTGIKGIFLPKLVVKNVYGFEGDSEIELKSCLLAKTNTKLSQIYFVHLNLIILTVSVD